MSSTSQPVPTPESVARGTSWLVRPTPCMSILRRCWSRAHIFCQSSPFIQIARLYFRRTAVLNINDHHREQRPQRGAETETRPRVYLERRLSSHAASGGLLQTSSARRRKPRRLPHSSRSAPVFGPRRSSMPPHTIKGIRPDLVINDTARTSVRELVEAKT
jgi:hypothetical protein